MELRNSIKRKIKKKDQSVYDLTELGYNLRIIFMKSLYSDGEFAGSLLSNIVNSIGDKVLSDEINSSIIRIELSEMDDYNNLVNIIDSLYLDTIQQYENTVCGILNEYDIDIPLSEIPVMTNITRYGNSLNIAL